MKFLLLILILIAFRFPVSAQDTTGRFLRTDSSRILNTVIVTSGLSTKAIRQQPVNIAVIDARPYYSTNITGLDLLRQASGIKIRQNGGFGATSEFFINGSSGKQVKFFIDGLPQDNLGETQLLSIYPVEQIERLEIYKGVLPVELGADALGGAINIVTRKEREDYVNASYSVASFNTHKVNILGKKYITRHFFTAIQANLNYAGNNYPVEAALIKPNGHTDTINAPLFHDLYKNYNLQLQVGYTDTKFANHLTLTLIKTGMYDELQHSLMMQQPYGYVYRKEHLQSAIVRYQKNNVLPKTDVLAMISYNKINNLLMDTSLYSFLWNGEVSRDLSGLPLRKLQGGELSTSGHELYGYNNLVNGKITTAYRLNEQSKIVFSNTYQQYRRTGRDPVARKFYGGKDYYSTPSEMKKNIAALGLEGKLLNNKWRYLASVKHFYTSVKGFEIDDLVQVITQQQINEMAFNAGIGYSLNEKLQAKISYEHAARLPEPDEAFGDFSFVQANPSIQAERSENLNINFLYSSTQLDAELGGFYRKVSDLIYLPPSQFYSRYDNLLNANVAGIEASARYTLANNISLSGNFTYQDLRNSSNISNRPIDNGRYKNSRMPNIPYLFGNGSLMYKMKNFLKKEGVLQCWYTANYTHEYFLYWTEDGDKELKNRIPNQLLHHAGIAFSPARFGISFAVEANNISNAKTYDNFRVQLPGRSFSFKIRCYQFNKK